MRMVLNNAPRLLWGDKPDNATKQMISWSAPLVSNIMGMYMNSKLREDAIETNKKHIAEMSEKLAALEQDVKTRR